MLSSKYSRTDLAVELFDPDSNQLPKGIRRKLRKSSVCSITEIIVDDMVAGIRIGKSKGRYITIETDRLSAHPRILRSSPQTFPMSCPHLSPTRNVCLW